MKNFFKPFNAESLLVALGLTFISYMITPIAKEFFRQIASDEKKLTPVREGDEGRVLIDKISLN